MQSYLSWVSQSHSNEFPKPVSAQLMATPAIFWTSNGANVAMETTGVDKNRPEKWTPLHYAAVKGHTEIAAVLIDNDANPKCTH